VGKFLDYADLNNVIAKGLGKFFPNFEFKQVDSVSQSIDVKVRKKELVSEKSLFGIKYGKKYEYSTHTETVFFKYRYEFRSIWFGDEFEISYAVSHLDNTIYWKLGTHRR
jgi:hypothetical protein